MIGAHRAALLGAANQGGFSPLDLAPYVWCDAQQITPQANDTDLTTWSDLSGNGRDFTQSSAADKPHYRTSGINGLPAVSFGTGQFFDGVALSKSQPFSFALVAAQLSSQHQMVTNLGSTPRFVLSGSPNAAAVLTIGGIASSPNNEPSPLSTFAVANGASSILRHVGTEATVNPGTGGFVGTLRLGTSGSQFGITGEFMFFDRALTLDEREQLDAYFTDRWGL